MENREKKSIKVIIEGAASIIDISGFFYFNSYRNYNPNQSFHIIWSNVGQHFNAAVHKYEKTKELVND